MDLLDKDGLERVFVNHGGFRACIHFAGLKAVGESVAKPLSYYDNNLTGTLNLLEAMKRHGCNIIGASLCLFVCLFVYICMWHVAHGYKQKMQWMIVDTHDVTDV